MSRGSQVVCIRIPAEMLAQIDARVRELETRSFDCSYTRTTYILRAVRRDLAHDVRARAARPRKAGK